jgi:WXG100 family type VII secretion target
MSTMPTSSFTTGMTDTGKRFETGVETIGNIKRGLETTLEDLAARWGGTASSTFQGVMRDWNTQHAKIVSELGTMAENLGVSGVEVQRAEDDANRDAGGFFNAA